MKQLLVLALTTMMVLALSTVSLAGTASLDYFMGTWEANGTDGDAPGMLLSLDIPFDPWKFGIDYAAGTWDAATDYDYTATEIKFGYLVSSSDALNFYLNLGYYAFALDLGDEEITGFLLSADLNFLISDTSSFDVSLGISLSGEAADGTDVSTISAKLKYSYFFTDSVGFDIGYRYYSFTYDLAGDPDILTSGFTLGLSFKF